MTNVHIQHALAAFAIVGTMGFGAWAGQAVAHADPQTINLTDIHNIDMLPVCHMEDGSDVAVKPCVWTNDGNAWLTYEDHSVLIIDNTAR